MYKSTKVIDLGSCAFRQPKATSHCRFIHGYRLKAKFWFTATHLDKHNWVIDFGALKALKQVCEKQFDHTFCADKRDPHISTFRELHRAGVIDLRIMDGVGIEKFAEWCLSAATVVINQIDSNTIITPPKYPDKMPDPLYTRRCTCTKVEVWEHEKNSAIYQL